MVRGAALAIGLTLAARTVAPRPPKVRRMGLHLRAIDLGQRVMKIDIDGLPKPPPSNFFTITDDRGRHYIPQALRCQPPVAGRRSCELDIPAGYEHHVPTRVELHLTGLYSRSLVVPLVEVRRAWSDAQPQPELEAGSAGEPSAESVAEPSDGGIDGGAGLDGGVEDGGGRGD